MMKRQMTQQETSISEIMGWSTTSQSIELLKILDSTGSINSAAKSVGLQYKSAWQKIEQINNLLPYPLVAKRTGGSGGGGTVLTKEGKQLLQRVGMLQKEFSQFIEFFEAHPEDAMNTLQTLRRIEMQLSARNVWLGSINNIDRGAVNSIVSIQLKGGDSVSSMVTDNSVTRLNLETGSEVLVIVKASSVMLGCGIPPEKISARNILTGIIGTINNGAVNDEVIIDLPGGSSVTSIITSASVKRLNLAPGKKISAIIKASDVLLALA